jgi:hypothetical protein
MVLDSHNSHARIDMSIWVSSVNLERLQANGFYVNMARVSRKFKVALYKGP